MSKIPFSDPACWAGGEIDMDYRALWFALKEQFINHGDAKALFIMDELEVKANKPRYIMHIDEKR